MAAVAKRWWWILLVGWMTGMRMDDGDGRWGCATGYKAQLKPEEAKLVPGQPDRWNCPFAGSLRESIDLSSCCQTMLSSWLWKRKSVLFKLINTSQLGPNLLFGYYRLRDRSESWHVLKKLWLPHAAKLVIDSTRLRWKPKKANGNHSSLPPTIGFARILLRISRHYFLSVPTVFSLSNSLRLLPTAPATCLCI